MKECDLIMKGGITSGVVYPKVITKLASEYTFVNIGGTSAGAIGAGFTAAAEFNRAINGLTEGFNVLDSIPEEISPRLLQLFEPDPVHKKTFRYLLKLQNAGTLKVIFSSIWNFFRIRKSLKKLPDTHFGLCSGLSQDKNKNLALTDWMNLWLEKTAGRLGDNDALPDKPLTFGMLESKNIKLRTVTTNLSQRTPVNLPNLGHCWVKKTDLRRLMPANIVTYIESVQSEIDSDTEIDNAGDYFILPSGDLMPVLLAIRLSLSFPVLLAAFPIYRVDYSKREELCSGIQKKVNVCWLSDGGITSNFPIHLFDSAFPCRPTFGISLGKYDGCRQEEDKGRFPNNRVYLPMQAGQGKSVQIHDSPGGLFSFLMSIFNAAQTWQDTNQTYLAGYRERIVRLSLKDDEGGLNLNMEADQIAALTDIGEEAGDVLNSDFEFDEHRWRRILSTYAAIELAFEDINSRYSTDPDSTARFLSDQIAGLEQGSPLASSYDPNDVAKVRELKSRLDALDALAATWTSNPLRDAWGNRTMPKPSSALKVVPKRFVN